MDFDGLGGRHHAAKLFRERYPAGTPADEALTIVTAVAAALDYASQRGLLHRDVKRGNILLGAPEDDGQRRVLLADFGIAREVVDPNGITVTNLTVGTVAYASPEQLMGADLDGRSDQYALQLRHGQVEWRPLRHNGAWCRWPRNLRPGASLRTIRAQCRAALWEGRIMPLGTVVRDVYTNAERGEIYEALNLLLRGNSWHRAGVYGYWDPRTADALYIGLASNLPARFAQHNSLRGSKPRKGNKGKQINDWFDSHTRLGFSLVLQEGLADEDYEPFSRNAEGQLLEGYRRVYGALPPWNSIGGSRVGAGYVRDNSAIWVDSMTGKVDGLAVARRTLRELNEDATAEYYEANIHTARTALTQFEAFDDPGVLRAVKLVVDSIPPYARLYDNLGDELKAYLMQPAPHPELS